MRSNPLLLHPFPESTESNIVVILLVNLIRTRSFDYAWRIAIVAGGVVYAVVVIAGGFIFDVTIDIVSLLIYTAVSVVAGLVLEFFVFGGDYTRTERLEYEDDEYYYYVKAVPKVAVTRTDVKVQRINNPVRGRHDRGTENYKERR